MARVVTPAGRGAPDTLPSPADRPAAVRAPALPSRLRIVDPLARRLASAPDAAARASIDACPFARPHPPRPTRVSGPVRALTTMPDRRRGARRGGHHARRGERRRRLDDVLGDGAERPGGRGPSRRRSSWSRRSGRPPTPYAAGHRGIDLAVAPGAPSPRPQRGTVSFAGAVAGRGVVAIDHGGGVVSAIEPVAATVGEGVAVSAGDVIGTVSSGGHCSVGLRALRRADRRRVRVAVPLPRRAAAGRAAADGLTLGPDIRPLTSRIGCAIVAAS